MAAPGSKVTVSKPAMPQRIRDVAKHSQHSHTQMNSRTRRLNIGSVIIRTAPNLFRLAFVACILYILTVCPKDAQLDVPACKALWNYREYILRPSARYRPSLRQQMSL